MQNRWENRVEDETEDECAECQVNRWTGAKSFVGETMVVCVCFSIAVYVSDNMSVLGTDMCIEQFWVLHSHFFESIDSYKSYMFVLVHESCRCVGIQKMTMKLPTLTETWKEAVEDRPTKIQKDMR